MAKEQEPVTIKKYANRRLYNTGSSTYVTLDDLALMVKNGEDFVVFDAKTGEDITRSVLTQIIVEQESKGPNLLPATFLRQLIRFYGDSMQALVPTYLDFSLEALKRDQGKLRSQLSQMFGGNAFGTHALDAIEEQVRRNTEMFEQAMNMFLPFGGRGEARAEPAAEKPKSADSASADMETLKRQLESMQAQLNKLADKG
jgi:polyhydroxyalkanoate synthesis repressor PhaR